MRVCFLWPFLAPVIISVSIPLGNRWDPQIIRISGRFIYKVYVRWKRTTGVVCEPGTSDGNVVTTPGSKWWKLLEPGKIIVLRRAVAFI